MCGRFCHEKLRMDQRKKLKRVLDFSVSLRLPNNCIVFQAEIKNQFESKKKFSFRPSHWKRLSVRIEFRGLISYYQEWTSERLLEWEFRIERNVWQILLWDQREKLELVLDFSASLRLPNKCIVFQAEINNQFESNKKFFSIHQLFICRWIIE